eukprot:COSAG06_NODE_4716_length_4014_cov_1.723116_2_plen_155_part_00
MDTLEGDEGKLQDQYDMLIQKTHGLVDRANVFPLNAKAALRVRLHMESAKQKQAAALAELSKLNTKSIAGWDSLAGSPMCEKSKDPWSEEQVLLWLNSIEIDEASRKQISDAFADEETDGDDLSSFNLKKTAKNVPQERRSTGRRSSRDIAGKS